MKRISLVYMGWISSAGCGRATYESESESQDCHSKILHISSFLALFILSHFLREFLALREEQHDFCSLAKLAVNADLALMKIQNASYDCKAESEAP
jgi:hypothetical protein